MKKLKPLSPTASKRVVIAITLLLLSWLTSRVHVFPVSIFISLEITAPNDVQLFFSSGGYFVEENSIITPVTQNMSQESLRFDLPDTDIVSFRMDPGNKPGMFSLFDFCARSSINSHCFKLAEDQASFEVLNHLSNLTVENDKLTLSITGNDPSLRITPTDFSNKLLRLRTIPFPISVLGWILFYYITQLVLIPVSGGVFRYIIQQSQTIFRPSFSGAIVACATLIVSLLLAEIYLRVFVADGAHSKGNDAVNVYKHPAPYTMFIAAPGQTMPSGAEPIVVNERGYRGKQPSLLKKEGEIRIFIVGGSTVFHGDPPIPTLVENRLHSDGFSMVQVFNYGVVASVSGQDLARLIFEITDYQPDVVVFYGGGNDILMPYGADPRPGFPFNFMFYEHNPLSGKSLQEYPTFSLLVYGSALTRYFFLESIIEKLVPLKQMRKEAGYGSTEWRKAIATHYIKNMNKAHLICQAFGIKFTAIFQPLLFYKEPLSEGEAAYSKSFSKESSSLSEQSINYSFADAHEIRSEILAQSDQLPIKKRLEIVNFSDLLDGTTETVFRDAIHPEQKFIGVIADKISDLLKKELSLN